MNSRLVDAVVIGAGPYGLATASHLQARGVACRVVGTPMAGWTDHMPKGMYLKSTALDSSIGTPQPGLTIGDFCREHEITPYDEGGGERPIPIDEFVAYGRWFQARAVPHVEEEWARRVEQVGLGYRVYLDSGQSITTSNVVIAAGVAPFAYTPPELADARVGAGPRALAITHASEHPDLSVFAGRRVAVVGAGQTARESAVLLHEAGAQVHVVVRNPPLTWPSPPTPGTPGVLRRLRRPPAPLGAGWSHLLLTRYADKYRYLPERYRFRLLRAILGPAGSWWLRDRFTPDIDVHSGWRVARAVSHGDGAELELISADGGSDALAVDHVIAATGYRVDMGRLDTLGTTIRPKLRTVGGFPRLSPTFESSLPGLYFVGLAAAASFGPMLRFVAGSDFAATRAAQGVAARAARRPAPRRIGLVPSAQNSAA